MTVTKQLGNKGSTTPGLARSDDAHDLRDLVGGHGSAVDDVDVCGG